MLAHAEVNAPVGLDPEPHYDGFTLVTSAEHAPSVVLAAEQLLLADAREMARAGGPLDAGLAGLGEP